MFEILIVEVITKHESHYPPYLGVIRILKSGYGCHNNKS